MFFTSIGGNVPLGHICTPSCFHLPPFIPYLSASAIPTMTMDMAMPGPENKDDLVVCCGESDEVWGGVLGRSPYKV